MKEFEKKAESNLIELIGIELFSNTFKISEPTTPVAPNTAKLTPDINFSSYNILSKP